MAKSQSSVSFWANDTGELRGPWLGQPKPGIEPSEFCPDIYSTGRHAFCTAFSPDGDELFFATARPKTDVTDLAWMRLIDGVWEEPQPAPFNSEWTDYDICMSPDGQRVCWRSWRPLPGRSEPEEKSVLWASDRVANGWSDPYPVTCGGEIQYGGYPGIARSGALYFAGRKSPQECCVYRAAREGDVYGSREPILCGMGSGGDLCIAPDESFLVIACWRLPENSGESDLYVSFRTAEGTWSPLRNLGPPINNELNENCPMVSPDGKRFFFRYDPKEKIARTFWVDAGIISDLQPESSHEH